MTAERDLSEKFPNPPLKEVAYEVRFPALLRIENEISQYQDRIREDFPEVGKTIGGLISPTGGIIGPGEVSWQFRNDDIQLQLRVKNNSLALISTSYKSFDDFLPKIKECTESFLDTYQIPYVTRIGLRYIDDFCFGDDAMEEFEKFFIPAFNSEIINSKDTVDHRIEIRQRKGEHFLTLRTVMAKDGEGITHYIMDTDSYHDSDKVNKEDIIGVVNELHSNVLEEFHRFVTDDFVLHLRGD